ncbi:hypothetical protein RN49_14985 [Pantoea agglomerans]|nr:hypothetical protein RN49_14985 [Pantoea agglomerans]MBA5703947.1 hypothetical protein [Pantoea agglomerans]
MDRPGHPWPGRFALQTRQPWRLNSIIAVEPGAQSEYEGRDGALKRRAFAMELACAIAKESYRMVQKRARRFSPCDERSTDDPLSLPRAGLVLLIKKP